MEKRLNIGSGRRKLDKDYIRLDRANLPEVDIVHDLEIIPYPFDDETFDEILAEDVLEHINNIEGCIAELYRIMKVGAMLNITGPCGRYPEYVWKDPTHKRGFVEESFDYWIPDTLYGETCNWYSKAKFKCHYKKEVKNKNMKFILEKI